METDNTRQEILLITSALFLEGDLCENDGMPENNADTRSCREKMEEACWNGLLEDWLWGIAKESGGDKKRFLWKVHLADRSLWIQL